MPASPQTPPEVRTGPFPFSRRDVEQGRLVGGVHHTLADYRHWRDTNPGAVAAHVDRYTAQLALIAG